MPSFKSNHIFVTSFFGYSWFIFTPDIWLTGCFMLMSGWHTIKFGLIHWADALPNFWLRHHGPNCRRYQPQKQSTLLAAVKTVFVPYPSLLNAIFSEDDRLSGSLAFIPSIGFCTQMDRWFGQSGRWTRQRWWRQDSSCKKACSVVHSWAIVCTCFGLRDKMYLARFTMIGESAWHAGLRMGQDLSSRIFASFSVQWPAVIWQDFCRPTAS